MDVLPRSEEIEKLNKVLPTDNASTIVNKNYHRKFMYRCENLASETLLRCQKVFKESEEKCKNDTGFLVRPFCSYFSTSDMCNFKNLFGSAKKCRPGDTIPSELGSTYTSLQKYKSKLVSEFKDVKFHYKVTKIAEETKAATQQINETVKIITEEYTNEKEAALSFAEYFMRILGMTFIFNILGCYNYMSNHLTNVEADNSYVTWYFRKIDYRRYRKGKFTLLPLKSEEKKYISDVYQFYLTTAEKAELNRNMIIFSMMLLFALLFIYMDYILYSILITFRSHGKIDYEQTGHHDLSLKIKGFGFLASILRSLAHNFVVKRSIHQYSSNEDCLPRPSPWGENSIKIAVTFVLLFFFLWMKVMLQRIARFVCSVFYPKAEKKRVIFLYNQTLKKRITHLNYRLDIVKKEASKKRIPEPLTFPLVLRIKHPRLFSWLLYFNSGRRSCVICLEREPKSGGENRCEFVNCYLYYCDQCWGFVVKQTCLGCPKYVDTASLAEKV